MFLIDTSSSMNQLTTNGMKLIDIAKYCVEHFIKSRQKHLHQHQKKDNYLLVTSGQKVVVGWKDSADSSIFLQRLKSLKANDLTEIGPSLKKCFDVLNQHRLQKSVDHYGMGRYASAAENSAIILITDGERLTHSYNPYLSAADQRQMAIDSKTSFDVNKLTLPNPHTYSTKLTEEPFRWDQRVFSIILQFQAVGTTLTTISPSASVQPSVLNQQQEKQNQQNPLTAGQTPTITDNPIAPISEVTGGLSRTISNMTALLKFMEDLSAVQLSRPSVIVNFEIVKTLSLKQLSLFPPSNNEGLGKTLLQLISQPQPNKETFWPIPENYLPSPNMTELPTRRAQPSISLLYTEKNDILLTMAFNKFPIYDIFEINVNSPIGKYVIQHSSREGCYKAFVTNSTPSNYGFGESFGFLKRLTIPLPTGEFENKLYFYLLPYNYMRLFYLMNEYVNTHKSQPSSAWIQQFHKFVQNLPPYYIKPLKIAMNKWFNGSFNHFPDVPSELPLPLQNYYKQLVEEEKRFNKDLEAENENVGGAPFGSTDVEFTDATAGSGGSVQRENSSTTTAANKKFIIRNPFDIDRSNLLKQFKTMSSHLFNMEFHDMEDETEKSKSLDEHLRKLSKEEINKHSIPISQMGNFDKVLTSKETLRDPFDTQKQKQLTFGSPYQKKKVKKMRSILIHAPLLLDKLVDESEMDIKQKEEEELNEREAQTPIFIEDATLKPTASEMGSPLTRSDVMPNEDITTPSEQVEAMISFTPEKEITSEEGVSNGGIVSSTEDESLLPTPIMENAFTSAYSMDTDAFLTLNKPPTSSATGVSSSTTVASAGKAANFRPPSTTRKTKVNPQKEQAQILIDSLQGATEPLKLISQTNDHLLNAIVSRSLQLEQIEGKRRQQLDNIRASIKKRKRAQRKDNEDSMMEEREIASEVKKVHFPNKETKIAFIKEIICMAAQFKKLKLAQMLTEELGSHTVANTSSTI
ncbi:hypothetical protein FDP41_013082 [Naegleria fowleri]|uniref:Uncharacterized protein n=1 Tax=Naegleria fowleri TaxID=5763 RepID=A0A6A5C5I9_NAEFO|nr:uncharacterized protein FDP41_013082 [Naegleria fowleri]KAF0980599.1 hypothetical protein FDP41_013082 [Naegleria fowleri]CAG4717553.1 unnamed protein product [Naegleria fowleri]